MGPNSQGVRVPTGSARSAPSISGRVRETNLPPFFMFLSHHIAKWVAISKPGPGWRHYIPRVYDRGILYSLRDGAVSGSVFA
jgi:hypothetical protein